MHDQTSRDRPKRLLPLNQCLWHLHVQLLFVRQHTYNEHAYVCLTTLVSPCCIPHSSTCSLLFRLTVLSHKHLSLSCMKPCWTGLVSVKHKQKKIGHCLFSPPCYSGSCSHLSYFFTLFSLPLYVSDSLSLCLFHSDC